MDLPWRCRGTGCQDEVLKRNAWACCAGATGTNVFAGNRIRIWWLQAKISARLPSTHIVQESGMPFGLLPRRQDRFPLILTKV